MGSRYHHTRLQTRAHHSKALSRTTQKFVDKVLTTGALPISLGPHVDIEGLPEDMNELVAHTLLSVQDSIKEGRNSAARLVHESEQLRLESHRNISRILQRAVLAFISAVGRESGINFFATDSFAQAVHAYDPDDQDTEFGSEDDSSSPIHPESEQNERGRSQQADEGGNSDEGLDRWQQGVRQMVHHPVVARDRSSFPPESGFEFPDDDVVSRYSTRPSAAGRDGWDAVVRQTTGRHQKAHGDGQDAVSRMPFWSRAQGGHRPLERSERPGRAARLRHQSAAAPSPPSLHGGSSKAGRPSSHPHSDALLPREDAEGPPAEQPGPGSGPMDQLRSWL